MTAEDTPELRRGQFSVKLDHRGSVVALRGGGAEVRLACDEWYAVVDGARYSSNELTVERTTTSDHGVTIDYVEQDGLGFAVAYELRGDDGACYLERSVVVDSPRSLWIGRIEFRSEVVSDVTEQFEVRTFSECSFATVVRLSRDTLLTGIMNPHGETNLGTRVEIGYRPALLSEGHFRSSPQFFAVVGQSGNEIQPITPKTRVGVGETRNRGRFRNPSEARPLDLAEIAQLRDVVRTFLSPLPITPRFILYTYWLPLPILPTTPEDERIWVDTLDNFADLGGDLILTVPLTKATVPNRDGTSYWDLEPAGSVAERIMGHARSRGLEVGYYAGVAASNAPYGNQPQLGLPLDGPDEWRKVNADGSLALENCLAVEGYREWLTAAHSNTISRFSLAGWSWDPGPGSGRNCFATNHGHEPGLGNHKGWLEGQKFIAELHAAHPRLHLQGFYGQKEEGTWGMRGISQHEGYWEQQAEFGAAIYPDLSAERVNANGVRQQAWWSQNFRFLPAEINHSLFGRMSQMCLEDPLLGTLFDHWGWRFGLLSAIASGSAPTASTLPPMHASSVIRDEFRAWINWSKANSDGLVVDVAGGNQVELGGVDWQLRRGTSGTHLFVFNPGPRAVFATIELGGVTRLTDIVGHCLRRLHPADGPILQFPDGTSVVPESAAVTMEVPPYEALVFRVEPAGATPAPGRRAALASVAVPLLHWSDTRGAVVDAPNVRGVASSSISTTLGAVASNPVDGGAGDPDWLRSKFPLFPDTFAYVDPERVILMIPLRDADAAGDVRVRINGHEVASAVFEYTHEQMTRFGDDPYRMLWPETRVVWWSDLTGLLAHEKNVVTLDLPKLGSGEFLGPVLQVPARAAAGLASSPSSERVGVTVPTEAHPLHHSDASDAPRVDAAWTTPAQLSSGTDYSIFARARGASAVFASGHVVGMESMFDVRLTEVAGDVGLWSVDLNVGPRATMILDPAAITLWAIGPNGTTSDDYRLPIDWYLDQRADK